jgi:hypothetical protein
MRYLLKKISSSKYNIISQFKVGSLSYNLNIFDKVSNITLNGFEVVDCSEYGFEDDVLSHLIIDLLKTGIEKEGSKDLKVYLIKRCKIANSVLKGIKKELGSSVKIVEQSMEIPHNKELEDPKSFSYEYLMNKLKNFIQAVHDINETLKVCREDLLSLSRGKLIDTMWGAKKTQKIIDNVREKVLKDEEWERVEFYVNILKQSVERFLYKLIHPSKDKKEDMKVINSVLVPNILENFEKIKGIISNVMIMLSRYTYIDEVFKKNTSYPASWFINGGMFEDLKLDYRNLILFILKIPHYEHEILYPLDMMRHNFSHRDG